jgi:hypothetical protein
MLEGKIFFPETGMPMWKSARIIVVLAVALPEPFTVPKVMLKSLTIDRGLVWVSAWMVGVPSAIVLLLVVLGW